MISVGCVGIPPPASRLVVSFGLLCNCRSDGFHKFFLPYLLPFVYSTCAHARVRLPLFHHDYHHRHNTDPSPSSTSLHNGTLPSGYPTDSSMSSIQQLPQLVLQVHRPLHTHTHTHTDESDTPAAHFGVNPFGIVYDGGTLRIIARHYCRLLRVMDGSERLLGRASFDLSLLRRPKTRYIPPIPFTSSIMNRLQHKERYIR